MLFVLLLHTFNVLVVFLSMMSVHPHIVVPANRVYGDVHTVVPATPVYSAYNDVLQCYVRLCLQPLYTMIATYVYGMYVDVL